MAELGKLEYYLLAINVIGALVYLINMLLYRHTARGQIDVVVTIVSLLGGSAGMLLMILLFDRKAEKENMMSRVVYYMCFYHPDNYFAGIQRIIMQSILHLHSGSSLQNTGYC